MIGSYLLTENKNVDSKIILRRFWNHKIIFCGDSPNDEPMFSFFKNSVGVANVLDYVDIIESHHEEKLDAPSGTSLSLARAISENKIFKRSTSRTITLEDTTGGDFNGIGVHSLRQPGRLAHHEVIFGSSGETLTLRHDTLDRGCCMPGVILAIRKVQNTDGLIVGLDKIMEL